MSYYGKHRALIIRVGELDRAAKAACRGYAAMHDTEEGTDARALASAALKDLAFAEGMLHLGRREDFYGPPPYEPTVESTKEVLDYANARLSEACLSYKMVYSQMPSDMQEGRTPFPDCLLNAYCIVRDAQAEVQRAHGQYKFMVYKAANHD